MKKKIRVAVLMGGRSPEHEVSLATGRGIVEQLNPQKYEALPIVISKDGTKWQLVNKTKFLQNLSPTRVEKSIELVNPQGLEERVDAVFIAMHGPYGEDGAVQGMLELLGVPYTGSGVLASALGMDKVASRKIWQQDGLPTIPYYIVRRKKDLASVAAKFKFPFVLKPADQGSSVGVSIVNSKKDFSEAWKEASGFGGEVIAEPFMDGMEVTCGVLGNEVPYALPPVEIVPVSDTFYSYKAKYEEGGSEHIIPPRLSKPILKKIQDLAVRAFMSLGCRGFARVDMFVVGKKTYISEINTIPGLTPTSLLPDEAKAAGISYSELLDLIIGYAREEHGSKET